MDGITQKCSIVEEGFTEPHILKLFLPQIVESQSQSLTFGQTSLDFVSTGANLFKHVMLTHP